MASLLDAPRDPEAIRRRVGEILQEPAYGEVFAPPPIERAVGGESWLEGILTLIGSFSPLSLALLCAFLGLGALWLYRRRRPKVRRLPGGPSIEALGEAPLSSGQARELGLASLAKGELKEGLALVHRSILLSLLGQGRGERALRSLTNGEVLGQALTDGLPPGPTGPLQRFSHRHEEIAYGERIPQEEDRRLAIEALEALGGGDHGE